MKNTAINTLGYTGTVTLSQYIGSKKIKLTQMKNSGAYSLFNFLSDCLVGDFEVAKLSRPAAIRLLEHDSTTNSYTPCSDFIFLLTKPEKVYSDNKGIVRYSFAISRDILTSSSFNSIGLYSSSVSDVEPESFAAVCKINIPRAEIAASSMLVVDWELTISNMVE